MFEELAPVGTLQTVLARRVAVAAWRLERADRIEVDLFEKRRHADGGLGLALIRDGNGTRSFETLLRYRGAAMAEFWRALKTLKAEQAAANEPALEAHPLAAQPTRPAAPARLAHRPQPDEPERRLEYGLPEPLARGRALHEPAAPWLPNEPEPDRLAASAPAPAGPSPNEPGQAARGMVLPPAGR
jgi:hypothetical protein